MLNFRSALGNSPYNRTGWEFTFQCRNGNIGIFMVVVQKNSNSTK